MSTLALIGLILAALNRINAVHLNTGRSWIEGALGSLYHAAPCLLVIPACCSWLRSCTVRRGKTLVELGRSDIQLAQERVEHLDIASDQAKDKCVVCIGDARVAFEIAIFGYLQRKFDKIRVLHDELADPLITATPFRRGKGFEGSPTLTASLLAVPPLPSSTLVPA
jgi:hypothetical protein